MTNDGGPMVVIAFTVAAVVVIVWAIGYAFTGWSRRRRTSPPHG
jgi:hypothetical protein